VREAVRALSPSADVVVHTFPTAEDEGLFEKIEAVAERGHFDVHNITTHLTKSGVWIDLDLEVNPDLSFERAHAIATDLETQLHAELAQDKNPTALHQIADINVHIESHALQLVTGLELKPGDTSRYLRQIAAIVDEIPHARGWRDVNVQQLDGKVYLALHLLIDADQSIAEVHSISEEMENRLRREFPELGRVVIHAEPYLGPNTAGKS
jgi:divalent metal cation (Fe/Co/Zn/Cd) transporter